MYIVYLVEFFFYFERGLSNFLQKLAQYDPRYVREPIAELMPSVLINQIKVTCSVTISPLYLYIALFATHVNKFVPFFFFCGVFQKRL